ncbi:MAG: site-specific DNA-methyltransferase [Bdellovibrionales bacterium]|nr:site-specific DNA-methyltransferase [Bdellovibrionales bacterium]
MGKPARKIDITQFKHKKKKRKNNPSIGLVSNKTEPLKDEKKKKYAFDCHISPELKFDPKRAEIEKIIDRGLSGSEQEAKMALEKLKKKQEPYLNWTGKAEQTSFEIPTVSLHTHEKIDSRAIIEKVRKTNSVNYEQLSLFKKEQIIPENEAIDFYKHDKGWSNRLIAGDSLLVMNSLLEKEGMTGKIQCIYIDPPYGIKYGSNFQPFTNKRDVKDKEDKDLTAEPEMLKAFRDTWELGIHSYLTYLRDRLFLARELLTDSGSCFVQISDENVHLVRNLMDEIFGVKNFVRLITFSKTGSMVSKYLGRTSDYLLWFSKNKSNLKYNQLFSPKLPDSFYSNVELKEGTIRKITKAESIDPSLLPEGARIFRLVSLESSGSAKEDTPFEFEGAVFRPHKNRHWSLSYPESMEALKESGRIIKNGTKLRWKYYIDDYPLKVLSEVWNDTSGFSSNQKYVVETRPKVIERCLLMATNPGDVVFDPTCGSGTTAYVAEKWGRRWITCDTSRVAITLAKQRLMTSVFDYYKLRNQDEGISSGFQYKIVPHITLKSIANNEPPKKEVLYDQPLKDNKKARVTGPFTLEAVPSQFVQAIGQEKKHSFKYEWLDEVRKAGIRGKKGVATDMDFARLEKLSGFKYLHAEGETKNPRSVIISFGPEHSPLDKRQVELALKEVEEKKDKPDILAFASFHFDPEASRLINEQSSEKLKVIPVQMNMDLQTSDLKKKTSSNESFWLIGSPDVEIKNGVGSNKDEYAVEVHGWDYYNPSSGKIESGGKDRIAMWILDTDYDDRAVFPRQVFFPMAGKSDGWAKLAKNLKSEIDEDLIEKYKGTKSLPFKKGKNEKIAVKIIDDRGIESLKIFNFSKQKAKAA